MLNSESRINMTRNVLDAIQWISDKEYQIRAWILGEEGSDFTETACFFLECSEPVLNEYKSAALQRTNI